MMILRMLTGVAVLVWTPAKAILRMLTAARPPNVAERAKAWLADESGVGLSSRTIHDVMTGGRSSGCCPLPHHRANAPHDADDFGRCARLLELIPEWVPRLGEVANVCLPFRRLVRCWPELTLLYERGDTAMLSVIIRDLRSRDDLPIRMTVKREWELIDAGDGDRKRAAEHTLPPGTHNMERIRNPLGYDGCWLVLKGTRLGASEGFWRQFSSDCDAEFLVTFDDDGDPRA